MDKIFAISVLFLFVFYQSNKNNAVSCMNLDNHPNLKLLPDDCGERITYVKNVSNRNDVFINQFPFLAAIQRNKERPNFVCSGSLINEKYVLTSAVCARIRDEDLVNVRFGEYNYQTEVDCDEDKNGKGVPSCNDPVQDVPIESRTFHEHHEPLFKNDIALIRLTQPVNLTRNNVRTVCLPVTTELRSKNYETGQMISFSYEDNDPQVLQRSFVHVIRDRKMCDEFYLSNSTYNDIKDKYICGHVDKLSGKYGRGGAALFQLAKGNSGKQNKFLQYGIHVGDDTTGDASSNNRKGGLLFLYIPEYMQWILDNLKP